jgi:tetratricopeptide (TPR) repeat protein
MMFSWKMNLQLLAFFAATLFFGETTAFTTPNDIPLVNVEELRKDWVDRSVSYYSKVMREERRRNLGQINRSDDNPEEFALLAKKHYFALRKIKDGEYHHAEVIYRRIIREIMNEEEDGHCDHATLAVTTLLLALHCQRMGDLKKTRSVFLNFFRVAIVENGEDIEECACSAKVLGAYALFEMKQGNRIKSLEIAQKAVELDEALEPVLQWKQFRDAEERKSMRP